MSQNFSGGLLVPYLETTCSKSKKDGLVWLNRQWGLVPGHLRIIKMYDTFMHNFPILIESCGEVCLIMCYKHKFLVKLFPEDIKVKGVNMWWRYGSFKFRMSKMEFKWCFWGVEFLDLGPVIDKTENPQPCIKQPDLLKWCYINMSLFVAGKRDPLLARLVLGEAKTVHKK